MRALEVLGPEGKAAIPDLVRLATNRARFFDQSRAVSALARMTPYSVSALTNIIFNDTKAETRAIEELYINDTNVSELEGVLLSILHGTNTRSKLVVGAALARFRGHERFNNSLEFIPALTNCLSTNIDADHETLTRNATYALANFGPRASSAIPAMLEAIRDGADDDHSDFNRCEAVGRALAKIDPDQGVQALVAQLQLTNRIARRNAAWALEAVKSKAAPAIPALIKSLDDPDPDVRVNAIVALREIHGEGGIVIPALIRKLNDSNEKVQWVSAIALGRFGPEAKEAVPGIRKVIKTCDEREKQFVVQALLEIDPTAQP
jgi:HEAT repeat protein